MSLTNLNEEELIVYELVREYLKKKPLFQLEEIIEFVNNRSRHEVNINKNKIEKILKTLMKNCFIVPGSKLVKEDILEVSKRVEIYDYITAMPGTYLKEIVQFHEIGNNHAEWHLNSLENFKFIRSTKFGNYKAYFKFDFDRKYDEVFFYIRNSKVKQIIQFLKEETSAKPTEISEKLSIHYNTVRKYLGILMKLCSFYISLTISK